VLPEEDERLVLALLILSGTAQSAVPSPLEGEG
jgi:hypothetical protein